MDADRVTAVVIGEAIAVHRELGHSGCTVGLLLNFNAARLVDGLRRVVRNHPEPRWRAPSGPAQAEAPAAKHDDAQTNTTEESEAARKGSRQPLTKKSPHPEKSARSASHDRFTR